MRRTALVVGLILAWTSQAAADEVHYENFRYGQRAMGAGGAMVAFPGEPEASWYNPAALALMEGTLMSGALQFFGTERHTLRGGLRADTVATTDLESSDVLLLPSSSVIAKAFGDDQQHVVAFSTFLASERDETFSDTITTLLRDGDDWLEQRLVYTQQHTDRIVYLGPSWGWRPNNRLALGVSVFYARREQRELAFSSFTEQRSRRSTGELIRTTFDDTSSATEIDDGALLARLGMLTHLTERLTLGATVTTQSVPLHGEGRFDYIFTDSGDPADTSGLNPNNPEPFREVITESGLAARTTYPWNFALGLAYEVPSRWTVATQVSLYLPSTYDRLDLSPRAEQVIASNLVNRIERQTVVNGALGAEWFITPTLPLRVGVFTNRSAAPDIPAWPTELMLPQVHLYGATTSLGFIGEDRSINVGAEVQWGSGYDVALRDVRQIWEPSFIRVEREQFRAVLFLAGAFDFAGKLAGDLVEDDEPASDTPSP
ncbi:MAG: hypothetical protein CMH57_10375 [Myxococcales bacterium]|nr:hypothetical protein [Myxococcales bacterium]